MIIRFNSASFVRMDVTDKDTQRRLQTCRKVREHGAAYLDMTRTGQEVVSPSYRLAPRVGRVHKDDEQRTEND